MDDQIKIYDTVRGNQSFLYYNSAPNGYNTTNSSKIKRSHWSNIFTWKKKAKSSPTSIINYQFPNNDTNVVRPKYGSMSAATGIAYTFAPPPLRHSLLPTTAIHASIKTNSPNKQNRNSLFYSPWESFHDQSVDHCSDQCTCATDGIVDIYCSAKGKHKAGKGTLKSVPVIETTNDTYQSRRYSRMDLYSLEEESISQKQIDFKSKSSDSLYKPKNELTPNRLKSSKSSTTLSSNPYKSEPIANRGNSFKDMASATVNERFLRFFKKSSSDPYNSIASRKSILECEVSAYDLIKQKLKSSSLEDDIDDNLSDNAIENENNMINVGKALKSNRKSIKSKSSLIEPNSNGFKSGSESDTGINSGHSPTSRIRIAGHGMHFVPQTPISSKCNVNNSANRKINEITKIYSTLDSSSATPGSSLTDSWSASSDESMTALPEPDYDTDENDSYQINSETNSELSNFQHLRVSYSPPLTSRRIYGYTKQNNVIYEKVGAKNISSNSEHYSKLNYSKSDNKNQNSSEIISTDISSNSCVNLNIEEYTKLPYSSSAPGISQSNGPPPPPPPPCPKPPPLPPTTNKSALKSGSINSNVTSYQNELKNKLNSGVKSILKKTLIINERISTQQSLNNCENDVINENESSETCDYLKAYKEFKESRLRGGRRRKHVHFKSQYDDTLIIEKIRETIIEVDEIDEPIYDDVQIPCNSDNNVCETSLTNDQNYINDESNYHISKDLNFSSQSTSSDTIKSAINDKALDKEKEVIEFCEFDPSEDSSSSSSSWMKRIDLKAKEQSLTKSRDFSNSCTSNSNSNSNSDASREAYQVVRGPNGPSKNVFPSPAATNATNSNEQQNSLTAELRAPIVKRQYLPVVTQSPAAQTSTSPNITARDELISDQQGKNHNYIITKNKSVAITAQNSVITSSNLDNKNYSFLTDKSDTTIDHKEKQLTLPVSQEINTTNTNKKVISEPNVQLEKQTTSNTEIEICNPNHSLGARNDPNFANTSSSPSHEGIKTTKSLQSTNDCTQNANPFMCTISITNSSNNKISNQNNSYNNKPINNIDTNVNSVSLTGDFIPFRTIGSSISSSSVCDCFPQSPNHLLSKETIQLMDKKPTNQSPITILCSNPNDKIIINVPLDNNFDNINEHIYEELEPIYVDTDDNLENVKSIFDGASKDEILEFLEDAKERVREDILVDVISDNEILEAIDVIEDIDDSPIIHTKNLIETSISSNRRNRTSNVSNSSTDSTTTTTSSIDIDDEILKCAITNSASVGQLVERNDSGVGAETSKPSRLRKLSLNDEVEHQCADCEMHVDPNEDEATGLLHYPLFCHRCDKKRSERKEIISEIVDTEFKYGRDLRIIREEFYRPIEIAGLLSKEQLKGVFLNLDELIAVNSKFSEKLQDAIDIATEQGDEDYTTVNIGKIFRDSSAMLHAFEVYCVRQGSAALLLNHLEKEKELLRIFLRVSQMENTLLRRMNLRSFLVVPVQRVTKYPLLLNRLYKVTPYHHRDREALKESQQKVELHLEHINQQTKGTIGTTTRIWRRISNLSTSHRRLNNADDIGNIKMRKAALEILKWNQEETQFVTIGKVFFTPITDYSINKKAKTLKFLTANALLVTLGKPNENYRPDLVNTSEAQKDLMFPRDNTGITDAVLLLIKEKCGRYVLCKETLHLGSCVISSESDSDDMFEIHEQTTKDSFLFKAESLSETKDWLKQLRYHSKDLGNWRRRRNALANIMMVRQ